MWIQKTGYCSPQYQNVQKKNSSLFIYYNPTHEFKYRFLAEYIIYGDAILMMFNVRSM